MTAAVLLAHTACSCLQVSGADRDSESAVPEKIATFSQHATEVLALEFDRDARLIVSASANEVCQWEADTGQMVGRARLMDREAAIIQPNGPHDPTMAFTETFDQAERNVVLRTAISGRRLAKIPRTEMEDFPRRGYGFYIETMAFSPDGSKVVTCATSWLVGGRHGGRGGVVRIWDAQSGRLIHHLGDVRREKYVYSNSPVTKTVPSEAAADPLLSTSTWPISAAFSADGKYLAVGTSGYGGELPAPGEIWIWDTVSGRTERSMTMAEGDTPGSWRSAVTSVALSHDGRWLAAAVGLTPYFSGKNPNFAGEIRVWDRVSGRQVHTLIGHKGLVSQLEFSPDGKWLASAGSDGVVRLWDRVTGRKRLSTAQDEAQFNALAFSSDGRLLAAGGGSGLQSGVVSVWELASD